MAESQLEWIPVYIDRLLQSERWRFMVDYQRGWYWSLLVESVRSKRPGYLRHDENLWRLAGARSEQFFERENAAVLACFESREISGDVWIYNERMVRTLEEQTSKLNKKRRRDDPLPSYSVSVFEGTSKNTEGEVCPDLPASALARGMCEVLELPATMGNLKPITAAIEAVAKRPGYTVPKAYEEIRWKAVEAKANGEKVNKFWFEDSRWGVNGNVKPSKAKERFINNLRAVGLDKEAAKAAGAGSAGVANGSDTGNGTVIRGDPSRLLDD